MVIERCFPSLKRTGIKIMPMYRWASRRIKAHVKNAGWHRFDAEIDPIALSVRPHSVIPGLTRNPCSSERDGGNFPETFSPSKWTPDQGPG